MSDEKQQDFINSMVALADRPVRTLIAKCEGLSVDEKWGTNIMDTTGEIHIVCKNGKKYNISLDVVGKNYMVDLGDLTGEPRALEHMSFLIHCARSVIAPIEYNRTLKVDPLNTTIYFHTDDEYRLGIIIK